MCWKFGLINNMIPTIWKNRNKIFNASGGGGEGKQSQQPERSDVNEALLKWFSNTEVTMD